ncbi:MAG: hypothetical protein R2826_07555 [Thermoleophilia bacterium]
MARGFAVTYRPLYFLSALGMGGLAISFFVYLMFLVPHPGEPIPNFSHIAAVYDGVGTLTKVLVAIDLALIAYFALRHVQLLVRNILAYRGFARSAEFAEFRQTNAEVSLLAIPLTYAMSVNVAFVLGALFVPGLWGVKEYLFPFALLAFAAIGAYAFGLFGRYLTRILTHRNFDIEDTNHFSQVLPSFAFAMIATGFAASAAMSDTKTYVVIGLLGTFLFFAASVSWIAIKLPVSFGAMLRHGMATEAGPTLWMGIPIFTLFGITILRDASGIAHTLLHTTIPAIVWLVFFGLLVAAQVVMGLTGWAIMRRQSYFKDYIRGEKRSIAAYGLICPGVAVAVLAQFFIHWGLVSTNIVAKFSPIHLALLAVVAVVQIVTIATVVRLNRKLLGRSTSAPGSLARTGNDEPEAACA